MLRGRPDATHDQPAEAAALVALDEVVDRLHEGWGTPVGDAGTALSGGERQRLHLARVTLQDPRVLVLGEATAALDPKTENMVFRWIESQRGRRTVVVVAHHLHAVIGADQVVVLDAGRIVKRGTHQELIAVHSPYWGLWNEPRAAGG